MSEMIERANAATADWRVLKSGQDASVNFVRESGGGVVECRYVRRVPEYFIAYLSSHTGCKHACRFCHLTATGQTSFEAVDVAGFLGQADRVLAHHDGAAGDRARRVHYNWMARGEPLSNAHVIGRAADIFDGLGERARSRGLAAAFNLSTILPVDFGDRSLESVFGGLPARVFYSLYSLDPAFRRRWLPRALPAHEGLDRLAAWQRASGQEVVLHWASIAGENDDEGQIHALCDAVQARGIRARFNLVRYNPFDARRGRESPPEILERNFALIRDRLGDPRSRIVPRVGFDVHASCGMFVAT